MKKQKRPRKDKITTLLGDARQALAQKATVAVVTVIFLLAVILLVRAFLFHSGYFRVKVVRVNNNFLDRKLAGSISQRLLKTYKGVPIFDVDLKTAALLLRGEYTEAKDAAVMISLPDKLVIDMRFRKPLALVRSGKIYLIDEDGFVMSDPQGTLSRALPVIEGVDLSGYHKVTNRIVSKNLKAATELLRELKRSDFLSEYAVSKIDARDPRNLMFYFGEGMEVRIGSSELSERIQAVKRILKDPRLVLDKVKYIDARFGDVVIGPKDPVK